MIDFILEDYEIILGLPMSETETLLIKSHAIKAFLIRQDYSVFLVNLKPPWISTESFFFLEDLSSFLKVDL